MCAHAGNKKLELVSTHDAVAVLRPHQATKVIGAAQCLELVAGYNENLQTITVIYASKVRMRCPAVIQVACDPVCCNENPTIHSDLMELPRKYRERRSIYWSLPIFALNEQVIWQEWQSFTLTLIV